MSPIYTGWIDYHPDDIEVIGTSGFSGGPLDSEPYIAATTYNGGGTFLTFDVEGRGGSAHVFASLSGPEPALTGGLNSVWHVVRELGNTHAPAGDVWTGSLTAASYLSGGNGRAGYRVITNGASSIGGGPNTIDEGVYEAGRGFFTDGFVFDWQTQFFRPAGGSDDPMLLAEFAASVAASAPPGYGDLGSPWSIEFESYRPIFRRYQLACTEMIPPDGSDLENFSGVVLWGYNPTGSGWVFDGMSTDDPHTWLVLSHWDSGLPGAPLFAEFSGGSGGWVNPLPEWVPGWDLETGQFTPATQPYVTLTGYHDLHAEIDGMGEPFIVPGPANPWLNGYHQHHVSFREYMGWATKVFWGVPRYRFVKDGEGVIRQYPRDDEKGWGSATRLIPFPKANRTIGGIQ